MADAAESEGQREESQSEEVGRAEPEAEAGVAGSQAPEEPSSAPGPPSSRQFPGQLSASFDEVLEEVGKKSSLPLRIGAFMLQPLLGALSHPAQQRIATLVGNPIFFNRSVATGINVALNLVLYPVVFMLFAVGLRGPDILFEQGVNGFIFLGFLLGLVEGCYRLRDGVFRARPPEEMAVRASLYGLPLSLLLGAVIGRRVPLVRGFPVPVEGFYTKGFVEKLERERRYGQAYTIEDLGRAYQVRLEFPRRVPDLGLASRGELPDEMPDYNYDLFLEDGHFVIKGRCDDHRVRKMTENAGAFPAEFTTVIPLEEQVSGFSHRYRDKLLEILLVKGKRAERPL